MSEPLAPSGNLLATDSSLAEHLLHSGRDVFARFQTTGASRRPRWDRYAFDTSL
jgi:hypothetical protein